MRATKANLKKVEITPALKQKVADLAIQNQLAMIVLFGSQSTGNVHEESDVDIAYQPECTLSAEQEVKLNYELTTMFGNDHVDTVNLVHASPLLAREVLDEATVLYDKTGFVFPAFELHALRSFAEARSLFDMRREKIGMFAHKA